MIFKYKMDLDSLTKLSSSRKQLGKVQEMLSTMLVVFNPEENTNSVYYTGNRNIAKFDFDISDFTKVEGDDSLVYFMVKIDTFLNIVDKALVIGDTTEFTINTETNNIIVYAGKTRYSTTCYERSDETTVRETMNNLTDLNKGTEFADNTCTLTLTKEVVDFYSTVAGSMLTKANAIAVDKNKLRYADNLSIIEYECGSDVSSTEETEHIMLSIYELAKIALAKTETLEVLLSSSRSYAWIKCPSLAMEILLALEETKFKYPTLEELESYGPALDKNTTFTFTKESLMKALGEFDGIFEPTLWKLKPIKFDYDMAENNQQIKLSWSDYNAEIESTCGMESIDTVGEIGDISTIISTLQVNKLLSLLEDTDVISLQFSDAILGELNGAGIIMKTKNYNATIVRLSE